MPKRQLLFIEDEGYVIARVDELLKAFPQFAVTRVSDAEEARALLEARPFDIVIADIYMHGASALELSYKAREKNKDAGVIIITGVDSVDLAVKAVKEGALDYVIKPPGLERIAGILKLVSLVRGLVPEEDGAQQP